MQVDFIILGAQKCGTSTLFDILDTHPSLVGSHPKELNFFSLSKDWRANTSNYESSFEQKEGVLYFEASPNYTFFPGGASQPAMDKLYPIRNGRIWDDMYEYNSSMKFIYLVRNPMERIVSSYMHHYARGFTDLDLREAVWKDRLFIDVTRYYTQIIPYIRTFGRQNVLILEFDDLLRNRQAVIQDVSTFLSIDPNGYGNYDDVHSNASTATRWTHHKFDNPSLPLRAVRRCFPAMWNRMTDNSKRSFERKPVLDGETKQMILHMLELEVRELQALMNKDLSKWTAGNAGD